MFEILKPVNIILSFFLEKLLQNMNQLSKLLQIVC